MARRPDMAVLASLAAMLLVALAPSAQAQSGASSFLISLTPSLTPWLNATGTRSFQGISQVGDVVVSRLTLGACTWRQFHYHATADETFFFYSGQFVDSQLVAPNNTRFDHRLRPGDILVYPKGWSHLQYNPTCNTAEAFVAFNSAVITTVNVVNNLVTLTDEYLNAQFQDEPVSNGLWTVSRRCIQTCGIRLP